MRVLVANLGSTSFKFKLLDMARGGAEEARGNFERIGQPGGDFASHDAVIDVLLARLATPPDAIGFKAVHGGPISGAVRVTDEVLATMQRFADVAPAHNPVYIAAMRSFASKLPAVPQVAAFETAFHQTIPPARQVYAIPHEWTETLGIRRYGFHGASHRYIAGRVAELAPSARRVISCHLGGSSSICAIEGGRSVANSFGMTAQSGVMHNNRVGDFDAFALLKLVNDRQTLGDVFKRLSKEGGLLGISGVSNDLRDVERAAAEGDARARLAIDAFVESVRHYVGAYLAVLGGCDALVFTGGIGENAAGVRAAACRNLQFAGIELDEEKNRRGGRDGVSGEARIESEKSRTQIWILPTNEELVVARQTVEVLEGKLR